MRQEDRPDAGQTHRPHKLPLGAFAAIDQKTVFIVFDDLRGQSAFCRGCRCRRAKKKYFKQN
jgi:7-keto-8-aminopelargonate synthetase-like enzyme